MTPYAPVNTPTARLAASYARWPTSQTVPASLAQQSCARRRTIPERAREVLIRRVYRIGVQTVERSDDRYFVTIRNRSYASEHEVPIETARRYYRKMKRDAPATIA
jgi:putative lipase involved disintegration of autophagic bodies